MKKSILLVFVLLLFNCDTNECTQDCGLQEVLTTNSFAKGGDCNDKDKVIVCHNGEDLCISINALQAHLDHGDTEGSCTTLAIEDYQLGPRKEWKIPCKYSSETINISGIEYYIHYY
jgi:hypothetical protein